MIAYNGSVAHSSPRLLLASYSAAGGLNSARLRRRRTPSRHWYSDRLI